MPTLGFRLAIRTAADDADEVLISSVPGEGHAVLTEPPTIDGASADLLEGTCDVGAATLSFWDESTTVTVPSEDVLFGDEFTYADLAAFEAAWPLIQNDEGGGTTAWSVDGDGAVLDIADAGIASSTVIKRERTITGLQPNTEYTVTGSIDIGGPDLIFMGIGVETIGTAGHTLNWDGLTDVHSLTQVSTPTGTITVRLYVITSPGFIPYGPLSRTIRWDWLRITEPTTVSTTGRVMTARLYDVQDAVARLTQLSRRCRIDQQVDGGEWTAYHRGYLNRLEVDGGEWTVTVGDTTRQEQQTELFATLPALDPSTLSDPLPIPMPRVGLILGGPIAADATYGTFAGIADRGPTRWKVEAVYTDPEDEFRTVRLKFLHGYLRPFYAKDRTRFDQEEWEKTNNAGRPYFQWDPVSYQSVPSATVNHFGYFPDLRVALDPVAGGAVVEKMPLARLSTHEPADKEKPKAEFDALTGNDSVLYVDWTNDATAAPFPAVNAEYDVTLYSPVISDKNPLLLAGHPVDLDAYAAALSGIPYNEASRVSCRAALGEGLWCELAIEGKQKFADFHKTLGGFFGFLFRPDLTTGERHFIPTRVRPAEPAFTITQADRVGGDGDDASLPPVWAVEEDSVVNIVKFATQRFRFFRYQEDSGDPPVHMMAVAKAEVEGARRDDTVNGDRTITYEIPGQLQLRAADGRVSPLILATQDPENPGYAEQAGGVIVDSAGWGVAESVVEVDAASPAAAAQIGDEVTVDLPDMPVPDPALLPVGARAIDRPGSPPRVARVVKRDPKVGAVQLTLVHAGELSQDAVAAPVSGGSADPGTPELPTLLLAASSTAPTTAVTVTLTNGADLSADNLRTELEYLAQAGTPAGADEGEDFGPVTAYPDGDLTTIDTPSVAPGSVVWVRARSVNVTTGVASAWTAWTSYTLDPITDGGTTPEERPYAPTTPSIDYAIDPATGEVTATVTAPGAASVKLAGSTSAVPADAAVRAATADSSAPFVFAAAITLTAGQIGYLAAYAYDATGNESAKGTATVGRNLGTSGAPFDLNLGELGDGTTDLTTGEREFVAIVSVEGTVEGWTCDGDVGAVTHDVETAPVVNGVDFVWTTRCNTGSDQRPAFSGTAPTAVTLSGANAFALTGRTAIRITIAAASGGAKVSRLAFHGTRS